MKSELPALCTDLRLRHDAGVAVVNSRDVAELFEKDHSKVLRDIRALEIAPDLARSWFRAAQVTDSYGREQPSIDMTRDGFTILAMGWTGEKAMQFKVRYIQAFNAMDAAIKSDPNYTDDRLILAIREIVAPLAVRFDGQDQTINRIESRLDGMSEDVATIKARLDSKRKYLTTETKRQHIATVTAFGGRCPCCSRADVIVEGAVSTFAEFDHFYQNSLANVPATWLICKPCHSDLTTGRVDRHDREPDFRAYQEKRRRLPGQQITLF